MSRIPVDGLFDRDNPVVRLYHDSSFRAKMAAGILVVLLVAGAFGTLTVAQTSSAVENRQADQYRHEVQLQNNRIDDWRMNHQRLAGSIATSPSVSNGDAAAMDAYLDHKEGTQTLPTDVVAVHIVDTNGEQPTVVASTVNETEGKTASNLSASWATDTLSYTRVSNAEMSGVYAPSYADGDVVAFSAQVDGHENKTAVVVTSLEEASKNLNSPVGGTTTVVNEEGTVVLSTNRNLIGQDAYESGHMSDSLWSGAHGETSKMQESISTGETTISGENHLSTAIHIEEPNWVVTTQTPTSLAYEINGIVQSNVVVLVALTTLAAAFGVAIVGIPVVRDLRRLTEHADEVSRGNFDADLDTDRGDEVGEVYQSVDRMRSTLQQRINEVENINNRIETVADEYTAVMEACADGDLSRRVDTGSGVKALDELGSNFNEMMADLEDAIAKTQQFGSSVGAASEEATQNIEQVEETSATVAEVAQEISDGAARQNEMLDEAVSEMNSLSSTIEEVAASADEVASQAAQTGEVANNGREAAQEAVGALSDIENQTDSVTATVTDLHDEVEEIEEITDYIQEIAEQTNMLAINAGIEAARAGEAGEGFGVVADEVKQLADDANDAAEDIEASLETIQERTLDTREEIEEMQDSVDEGSETIGEALESMGEIAGSVEETVTGIQEIDDATERQAESAQEVVKKMDSAADISGDTVEQASDAAAATEEQSASVKEISDSISHLATQASELSDLLGEFETDEN